MGLKKNLIRSDACQKSGVSRRILLACDRRELKVSKGMGCASDVALTFERLPVEELRPKTVVPTTKEGETKHEGLLAS